MPALELIGLSKSFGANAPPAVRDLNLSVAAGELVALVGGSGSGKTTTLRMINRLIEPTRGRIRVENEDVTEMPAPELRRRIGYVFQGVGLFPHMDVAANIAITPRLLGWAPSRIRERVEALLEMVELDPSQFARRRPSELSGGQRQRVGVARALAADPRLVLLDEPFGALDPATRETLQARFLEIRGQLGFGAVFVTHDMTEALLLGDRVAVMQDGQLVQVAAPRELARAPATDYVAHLVDTPKRQLAQLASVLDAGPAR